MHTRIQGLMAQTRWLVPAATALSLLGCPNNELAPLEPCTVSGVNIDAAQAGVDKVDMVFMIDNSGSMAEEQAKLGKKLTDLVKVLTGGDKRPGDPPLMPGTDAFSKRYFTPPKSLHIGIISSDLGSPPTGITVNADATKCGGQKDNGTFLANGASGAADQFNNGTPPVVVKPGNPACAGINLNPPYLGFGTGEPYPDAASSAKGLLDFGCVATTGTKGCGIEQQLESAYKVLAPPTINDFVGPDVLGHGANNGFLRTDSVLAVVIVSDEDDCSVTPAGGVMFEKSPTATNPFKVNVRCQMTYKANPADPGIRPVKRYIDGLLALRGVYKERLVFAGIVGLPQAFPNYGDFDGLLASPGMQVNLSPTDDTDLVSVCGSDIPMNGMPPGGRAYPGRRFVEVAKGIAAANGSVVLQSICDDDYTPALNLVIDKIAQALGGACLPRKLKVDPATGLVTCKVIEILPQGANAAALCARAGRKPAGKRQFEQNKVTTTRDACEVAQVKGLPDGTDPNLPGWYYDTTSTELIKSCLADSQRVVFSKNTAQAEGSTARVECFQPQPRVARENDLRGRAVINKTCKAESAAGDCPSLPGEAMICDGNSGTCQIQCANSSDCPEGWLCEGPTAAKFCQNPTCPVSGS